MSHRGEHEQEGVEHTPLAERRFRRYGVDIEPKEGGISLRVEAALREGRVSAADVFIGSALRSSREREETLRLLTYGGIGIDQITRTDGFRRAVDQLDAHRVSRKDIDFDSFKQRIAESPDIQGQNRVVMTNLDQIRAYLDYDVPAGAADDVEDLSVVITGYVEGKLAEPGILQQIRNAAERLRLDDELILMSVQKAKERYDQELSTKKFTGRASVPQPPNVAPAQPEVQVDPDRVAALTELSAARSRAQFDLHDKVEDLNVGWADDVRLADRLWDVAQHYVGFDKDTVLRAANKNGYGEAARNAIREFNEALTDYGRNLAAITGIVRNAHRGFSLTERVSTRRDAQRILNALDSLTSFM